MIGHTTISAGDFETGRRRSGPPSSSRRHLLLIAIAVSVGIHLAAALLLVVVPRVLPRAPGQQEQGAIELLMVEQKGAAPSEAGQPQNPAPAPPEKADTPKIEDQKTEVDKKAPASPAPKEASATSTPAPAALTSDHGDEPVPAPSAQTPPAAAEAETRPAEPADAHPGEKADIQPAQKQAEAQPAAPQVEPQPAPPQKEEGPVFDLAGTDSELNAIVTGGQVIPAMKDDRFRNRPPIYPVEAEMLGEHGTVVLLIHVSERGLATGADVEQSSGVSVLDEAAIAAARKWRFHPALKEGRPVPFDMPFRFIFEGR